MTSLHRLALAAPVLIAVGAALQAPDAPITPKQAGEMLAQLGYESKPLNTEAGKEKYQATMARGGLTIPIAVEVSSSGTYVWLTVLLGQQAPTGDKALELLRRNAKVQPTQFFVSASNKLMAGLAIENRGVTNAVLRQRMESLADSLVNHKDAWQ